MNRPTLTVAGQASEVVASDGSVVLNVPIALRQRSGRRVVAVGGSRCESGERTRTGATPLQLALARGHRWLRMIETGEVSSLREIARRDGADHSYVAKHLNLTLLAPDIVAAILEDALPDGVRLSALLINPPVLWEDQRAALGTTPAPPRVRKAAGSRAGAKGGFYGKTAAQGYATLRSRMRASLDAGCSGTTNTRRQTLSAVSRKPRIFAGFSRFWCGLQSRTLWSGLAKKTPISLSLSPSLWTY